MCGIIGYSYSGCVKSGQWKQTHQLLEALYLASEHRGEHATGVLAVTSPEDAPLNRQLIVEKEPVAASEFVSENRRWRSLRRRRCSTVLGHVRWVTAGSQWDNRNNHPHSSLDGRYHLVHNGIITDHERTAAEHGIRLRSDCDSELILRLVEAAGHPAVGLADAIRQLKGSMAVALYDATVNATWFVTNGLRSLWMMKLERDRRWFWASTRAILLEAFGEVMDEGWEKSIELLFPLGQDEVHVLSPDGQFVALGP